MRVRRKLCKTCTTKRELQFSIGRLAVPILIQLKTAGQLWTISSPENDQRLCKLWKSICLTREDTADLCKKMYDSMANRMNSGIQNGEEWMLYQIFMLTDESFC